MEKYLPEIKQFVIDNFLFGDGDSLQNDTSFMEQSIIDSTGVLELITYLEEQYGIAIDDEELVPENLDSLNNVSRFVSEKLNNGAS